MTEATVAPANSATDDGDAEHRQAGGRVTGVLPWWTHLPLTVRTLTASLAATAFAVIAQLPLLTDRPALFVANVGVAAGCVAGGTVLADEPRQRMSAGLLATAGLLWPVAWLNVWHAGPLPLIAALIGPLPQVLAIWGLLSYPRPFSDPRATLAMSGALALGQLVTLGTVVTSRPEWNGETPGTMWITIDPRPATWQVWLGIYNALVIVYVVVLIGLYLVRVARLPAFDRRVTGPVALAVVVAGLGTFASGLVLLINPASPALTDFYFIEDLLQLPTPAVLLISAIVRRSAPQRLTRAAASLRTGATPLAVEAAIGRALGDPLFRVYYRTAHDVGWTDSTGSAVVLPTTSTLQASHAVVDEHGDVVAMLVGSAHLDRYGRLLQTATRSFWLLLSNGRLLVALQAEVLATRQSEARLGAFVQQERAHIREQALEGPGALAHAAQQTIDGLVAASQPPLRELLQRAAVRSAAAAANLAELGLVPTATLRAGGLAHALEPILSAHDRVRADIRVTQLPQATERMAYNLVLAYVTNAVKHARASVIDVQVWTSPRGLHVRVADDGIGGADPEARSLAALRAAVRDAGGDFAISSRPGAGTIVTALLRPPHVKSGIAHP